MKNLPVSELEVVGVVYCIGFVVDDQSEGTAGGAVEYDFDVLNPKLKAEAHFENFNGKCDCCGQRLKYACEVVHRPTLAGYFVGRACASKIDTLRRFGGAIERSSVALAERAACNAREATFRARHASNSNVLAALDWAKTNNAHRIAVDLVAKIRRWGEPSEAQISLLVRLHEQAKERAQTAENNAVRGIRCPAGRVVVKGRVVSTKTESLGRGRWGGEEFKHRVVIDIGDGIRVWGTLPKAFVKLTDTYPFREVPTVQKGDIVQFSASVEVSNRDPLFGFFSRPAKPEILERAGGVAA